MGTGQDGRQGRQGGRPAGRHADGWVGVEGVQWRAQVTGAANWASRYVFKHARPGEAWGRAVDDLGGGLRQLAGWEDTGTDPRSPPPRQLSVSTQQKVACPDPAIQGMGRLRPSRPPPSTSQLTMPLAHTPHHPGPPPPPPPTWSPTRPTPHPPWSCSIANNHPTGPHPHLRGRLPRGGVLVLDDARLKGAVPEVGRDEVVAPLAEVGAAPGAVERALLLRGLGVAGPGRQRVVG